MPFILTSPSSANITVAALTELHQAPWIGKLELEDMGRWIDDILLLVKETCNSPPKLQDNTILYLKCFTHKYFIDLISEFSVVIF